VKGSGEGGAERERESERARKKRREREEEERQSKKEREKEVERERERGERGVGGGREKLHEMSAGRMQFLKSQLIVIIYSRFSSGLIFEKFYTR